ncbi:uncharacterized protein METZ01_LOCUS36180, partial [marine metagenome]
VETTNYDIITIGGGLGGAALAKVMADKGARVLVLESEPQFKDRVRGEVMVGWGVAEAQQLGIYEIMKSAGSREVEWIEQTVGNSWEQITAVRRHLPTTTVPGLPWLTFHHPEMQEAILNSALDSGATVHRGVRVRGLQTDGAPKITATVDGVEQEFTARLVVGADGRSSGTRSWGEFDVLKSPAKTYISGILFDNMNSQDDASQTFRSFDRGLTALLFPQGKGRVRAYLCYPQAWGMRLSGSSDFRRFMDWSVDAGVPAQYHEGATPVGSLASFDSSATWVEHPYRDQVALIGDAAGSTDPMWAQGVSLTLRDVRVLRDQLLSNKDWDKAGRAYAAEHNKYFTVTTTVHRWLEKMLVETGPEADARRELALPLWREDDTRRVDTVASGPDHAIDETVRRRFFGEE